MNASEQDFTKQSPASIRSESKDANYYAFFDKPSPENLAANRSGVLSAEQRQALHLHLSNQKTSFAIWNGILLTAALGMGFLFWLIDASDGTISVRNQFLNLAVVFIVLGSIAFWFRGEWFIYFMGDDLENAVVESAVGKVVWSGTKYRMRTDDRLLRSMPMRALPPPGDYRFYFLPHSGLVVMAEEVSPGAIPQVPELLLVLSNVNNFTLEDLKLNQDGRLSRHQENTLLWITALYLVFCVGTIILAVIFMPKIIPSLSSIRNQLILFIVLYLFIRFTWSAVKLIGDIWHGKVSNVEGPVGRRIHRARYSDSYYYVSDLDEFQVSSAAYHALLEGQRYRIYYVPRSRRLVSIEPS